VHVKFVRPILWRDRGDEDGAYGATHRTAF